MAPRRRFLKKKEKEKLRNDTLEQHHIERSGSVVDCLTVESLTRDQGVAGSSLTGGTALVP